MKVIFNHYVKIIVTFTIGPGPAQARESYAQARAAARKINIYRPGPGPGIQVSGPHPARPAKYYSGPARPGPWAAGRPGPRAEARPVQDTNRVTRSDVAPRNVWLSCCFNNLQMYASHLVGARRPYIMRARSPRGLLAPRGRRLAPQCIKLY